MTIKRANLGDMPRKPKPRWGEANKDRYRRSRKHETRVSGELGGKRLPRSGGLAWSKHDKVTAGGDLGTDTLLVEHKRTDKKSMTVQLEWLNKVEAGAARVLKDPAVVITFEQKLRTPEDWILIPLSVYKRLRQQTDEGQLNDEGRTEGSGGEEVACPNLGSDEGHH